MENVISEFKIIETDDGYWIEIKGNKEAIRRILSSFGLFGEGAPFQHGFRFGPWSWGDFGSHWGPWGWKGDRPKGSDW